MKKLTEKEQKKLERLNARKKSLNKKRILIEMELQPILDNLEKIRLSIDEIELN